MNLPDSYGIQKRLDFIVGLVREHKPLTILDFGCGTGNNLTFPLANEFKNIQFTGFDADKNSIDNSKAKAPANVSLTSSTTDLQFGKYDMVICSEVLEHVENPNEVVALLKKYLKSPDSVLVATVPNGYGAYEVGSVIDNLFELSGARRFLRFLRGRKAVKHESTDTMAISPHINFYSYSKFQKLMEGEGLKVLQARNRTIFCGFIFDILVGRLGFEKANIELADKLPHCAVAGWMFVLKQNGQTVNRYIFTRGLFNQFRRYLNEKRWGLR